MWSSACPSFAQDAPGHGASLRPIPRGQYVSRELRHARHAYRAARKMRERTDEPVITTSQQPIADPRERNDGEYHVLERALGGKRCTDKERFISRSYCFSLI